MKFKVGDRVIINIKDVCSVGTVEIITTFCNRPYFVRSDVCLSETGIYRERDLQLACTSIASQVGSQAQPAPLPTSQVHNPFAPCPVQDPSVLGYPGGGGLIDQLQQLAQEISDKQISVVLDLGRASAGCDCGGKKTFGLVSKETCARWCGSQVG